MRSVRNLIGLFVGLTILTAIVSAISAAIAKNRLISKGEETDNEVDLVTIYTGRDFSSRAPSFRGGTVLTWYGGGTVDLRGATLDPAGAKLIVRTIFGGFRLVVPETWQVENRITAVFGGVGDARDTSTFLPDGPTLTLEGFAVFGGVGIVSDAPDLDGEMSADSMEAAVESSFEASPEVPAPAPA